jgi:small subunit ribosomal protein S26
MILVSQVRYKRKEKFRKPIWDPVAPSKYYRVNIKRVFDEEEKLMRKNLNETYKRNMESIYSYFNKEFYLPTLSAGGISDEQVKKEEDEQARLLAENEMENARVARLREERMREEEQNMKAQMIVEEMKRQEEIKLRSKNIDEEVRIEIERSKTYITRDTLDAALEEALANPVTYDYAIDVNGNVHYDGILHPYALKPSAVPDTSSNTKEFEDRKGIKVKLEPTSLY